MDKARWQRLAWMLATRGGTASLFAVALLLQLALAPSFGFALDLETFRQWTHRLDAVGLHDFYDAGPFVDYLPGYLYLLRLTAVVSADPGYVLLKLPVIVADLVLAAVAGSFAARLAPASLRSEWPVGVLVTAGVLFNPAFLANGPVWGQVDVVPAVMVLAALLLLLTSRRGFAEVTSLLLLGLALSTKPQALFVLPVVVYALCRRHLLGRAPTEKARGLVRLVALGLVALAVPTLLAVPFGLGPAALVDHYRQSASLYPYTSVNAFNLWGALDPGASDTAVRTPLAVNAMSLGLALFAAGAGFVIWQAHGVIRRGADDALVLAVAAASTSLLGFVVLTRMHERYLLTALALLAPLAFLRPLRLVYAGLSALFVLNLWWVYAGVGFGGSHTVATRFWSLAVTALAATLAYYGARWAARAGAEETPPATAAMLEG